MPTEEHVREVKRRHSAALLQRPGVCGVGVEKDDAGDFVVAIHVDSNKPETESLLPAMLENCPVKIVRSGPFEKQ